MKMDTSHMLATGRNSTGVKSRPFAVSGREMPTITSAAPVAAPGIIRNRGLMKQHSRKKKPVVIAVRTVRPPASIPEADSAKVLIVEIPKKEPMRRNSFHIKSSPPAK